MTSWYRLGNVPIALCAALAACGGGGSDNAAVTNMTPTAALTAPANLAGGAHRHDRRLGDGERRHRRRERRVPDRRRRDRCRRSERPLLEHVRRQPLSGRPTRGAGAGHRYAGNLSAWSTGGDQFGGATTLPNGFTRNAASVAGLVSATAFAQAPDGRFFVAEQGGTLRVVKNGALLATAVLDRRRRFRRRARPDRRRASPRLRGQRLGLRLLSRRRPRRRTTASADSPRRATSPRPAARSSSSTCRRCRARPTTTAARCTSAPTASSTSASATTPTARRPRIWHRRSASCCA